MQLKRKTKGKQNIIYNDINVCTRIKMIIDIKEKYYYIAYSKNTDANSKWQKIPREMELALNLQKTARYIKIFIVI